MSIMLIKSKNELRQKLAGLFDTSYVSDVSVKENVREKCIQFISFLPVVFSDDLDRKTLWDRISNGIYSATTKCDNDFESFINFVLEYIKADSSKVAASNDFIEFLSYAAGQSIEWKMQFISLCQSKYFILVTYARQMWENKKMNKKETQNGK